MQTVRFARWLAGTGFCLGLIGCGGQEPTVAVPPTTATVIATVPPSPPPTEPTERTPQPTPSPIVPPRQVAGLPTGGTAVYPPRAFTAPTFTWRATPVAVANSGASESEPPSQPTPTTPETPKPEPAKPDAPKPEPAKPDAAPPKPEKPFEWPKDVNGKNLGEWVAEFRDPDPTVREIAVRVIPAFGPAARPVAGRKVMTMIADDPDPGVRMAAMTTAGLLGHESKDDIKPMIYALRMAIGKTYNGSAIRLFATRALATYGGEAVDAIPVLTKIHIDPWWETRQAIAQALGRIGAPLYDDPPAKDPMTNQSVPKRPANELAKKYLIQMAHKDDCASVRLEAVLSLISFGPPYTKNPAEYITMVQPELALIEQRLNSKRKDQLESDKSVQVWLHVLRVMLDDRAYKDTLPKIAGYFHDPSATVRAQALMAIGALGKRAAVQEVLAAVRDALMYEEEILVAAAVDCLMAMGSDAAGVLPDVEKLRDRTKNKKLKEIAEEGVLVLSGKKKWDDVLKERQKAAEEALREAAIPKQKED
ncbi:MAG: hypothetical protein LC104_03220 [Bacteroidales bacterium]|nr:hypothetical protein [Bacteroidales bacterium]